MKKNEHVRGFETIAETLPAAFRSGRDAQLKELVRAANVALVMVQRPYGSFLASKRIWQLLGRSIRPTRSPMALVTVTRKPVFGRNGDCVRARTVFGTRYVFDICDTHGSNLPSLATCELKERFADEHGLSLDYVSGAITIVDESP